SFPPLLSRVSVFSRLATSLFFPYTTLFRSAPWCGMDVNRMIGAGLFDRAVAHEHDSRKTNGLMGGFDCPAARCAADGLARQNALDRKSTTSELQSRENIVCRLLLEKKKRKN